MPIKIWIQLLVIQVITYRAFLSKGFFLLNKTKKKTKKKQSIISKIIHVNAICVVYLAALVLRTYKGIGYQC